jgi:hypothetical protein
VLEAQKIKWGYKSCTSEIQFFLGDKMAKWGTIPQNALHLAALLPRIYRYKSDSTSNRIRLFNTSNFHFLHARMSDYRVNRITFILLNQFNRKTNVSLIFIQSIPFTLIVASSTLLQNNFIVEI